MRAKRIIGFVAIIQSILFLTHLLLYKTWTFSPSGTEPAGAFWIKLCLGFLSMSFVTASLLAFRYTNPALRVFYRPAAVWIGLLSFLFLAAAFSWIIFGVASLAGLSMNFHRTGGIAVRCSSSGRTLRSFQRKLDADHANHSAARELAGGVARAKSSADQRPAPGACAKQQFSTAHGGEDLEGRAGRDLYRRRFV